MDKQNQMKKMAKIIKESNLCGFSCDTCKYKNISVVNECKSNLIAEELYNSGYRKIPEGAVVLTKEEFKAYTFVKEFFDGKSTTITAGELVRALQLYDKQARKETVDKFAELTKAKLNEWLEDNEDNDGKIDFGIAEIELIGVKSLEGEVIAESLIDEIAKEIMEGK